MTCPYCGKQLDDSCKFCPDCGANLTNSPIPPAEQTVQDNTQYEAPAEQNPFTPAAEQTVQDNTQYAVPTPSAYSYPTTPVEEPAKKKGNAVKIIIPIIAVILIAAIGVAVFFLVRNNDKNKYNDDKKDTESTTIAADQNKEDKVEKLTGEDLLIGDWNAEMIFIYNESENSMDLLITFKADGTVTGYLSKDSYDKFIDHFVEMTLSEYTDEELAAEGFASREEAAEDLREYCTADMPYEAAKDDLIDMGTWELDGDTLTIRDDDDEPMVIETELSKGVDTFKYSDDEGKIIFTKSYNTNNGNNNSVNKDEEEITTKPAVKPPVVQQTKPDNTALIIGEWKTEIDTGDVAPFNFTFTFNKNGTGEMFMSEDDFDDYVDACIDMGIEIALEEISEEDLAAAGMTIEDFKEYCIKMMGEEIPEYEDLAAEVYQAYTWELDGDELILTNENGDEMYVEVSFVSDSKANVTMVNENGEEIALECIKSN